MLFSGSKSMHYLLGYWFDLTPAIADLSESIGHVFIVEELSQVWLCFKKTYLVVLLLASGLSEEYIGRWNQLFD